MPGMHVHAFSPLEVWHGATTLGLSLTDFLTELHDAGLGSLPGTAAEVLDDEVRDILCPDKVSTDQWLEIMRAAHGVGLRSTATIMFGHVDRPVHWARHLLRVRNLQKDTGGFTELVPLPFVAAEAPIALKGAARLGPTFREAVLMHAIGRLALHPHIPNIQTSWVKMGVEGAKVCLQAGANDLGGTLMNESITRAAGAEHGEELPPDAMERLIADLGRTSRIRTTLYGDAGSRAPRRRPRRQGIAADPARGRRALDRLAHREREAPRPAQAAPARPGPLESTKVHSGVDRFDADGARVLGRESTNPPSRGRLKKHRHWTAPLQWRSGKHARHWAARTQATSGAV